jgi:thiol-disulfide isomerase/thioredoxin
MRRRVYYAWGLLGIVIVVMVVAWGRTHDAQSSMDTPMLQNELKPVKLRGPAPAFTGTTMTGHQFSHTALAGKPAVIDFFSSWCGPCKDEANDISRIAADYRGKVRFVGVDIDDTSKSAGQAFIQKHNWRFPVIWDPDDKLVSTFHPPGKPSMVLIDRHGNLAVLVPGQHMASEYRAAIDKLVSE